MNGADRNLQEKNGMTPLQFAENYPGVYVSSDMVSVLNCELLCYSKTLASYALFVPIGCKSPTQITELKHSSPPSSSTRSEVCTILWSDLEWYSCICKRVFVCVCMPVCMWYVYIYCKLSVIPLFTKSLFETCIMFVQFTITKVSTWVCSHLLEQCCVYYMTKTCYQFVWC